MPCRICRFALSIAKSVLRPPPSWIKGEGKEKKGENTCRVRRRGGREKELKRGRYPLLSDFVGYAHAVFHANVNCLSARTESRSTYARMFALFRWPNSVIHSLYIFLSRALCHLLLSSSSLLIYTASLDKYFTISCFQHRFLIVLSLNCLDGLSGLVGGVARAAADCHSWSYQRLARTSATLRLCHTCGHFE